MKKLLLLIVSAVLFLGVYATPDEGMWIPSKIAQMNYADMQKLGCKLTAEEIYSINNSSLKDAIFQLQTEQGMGFCTGEIVSKQGLLFTNHHCGYEAITKLSTTEHNYLDDGYWAKNLEGEISVPGVRVTRVVQIVDVTKRVLKDITDETSEADREKMIAKIIKEIEGEAREGNDYEASVSEMYQGGEYYLFTYEAFGDVRFVGAPPSDIGKFGGDTDNWMWPRHTGDFSIFRVYMSPDGKPTKGFDKNNVPYIPLHSLPISIKGVKEGDFAMIMGFPGQTERYLSSYGMKYKRDYFNPTIVNLLYAQLKPLKEDMEADKEVRLAYADSYAGNANGWKLFDGEAVTLKNTDAIAQREKLETDFQKWVNSNPERTKKYGKILENLKESYEAFGPATNDMIYLSVGLLQAGEHVMSVQSFMGLNNLLDDPKGNANAINMSTENLKSVSEEMFAKYFPKTDKKVFTNVIKYYVDNVPVEKRSPVFSNFIFKNYKAKTEYESIDKFISDVFEKSIFTNKERMDEFLTNPKKKTLEKDPLFGYVQAVFSNVFSVQMAYLGAMENIGLNERLFIEGLREFQKDRIFYPDANSTLRLTYGTVNSYEPRDAVHYHYVTYADGILEKEDPTNSEFNVPSELKTKILKKEFGQYADETEGLPICFLSDNDITGGNSGSPVINGEGHLIGLAFDGNWEWLCSNLIFSTELQRTINVDARYVLWVIDELYDAQHIMKELDVRK
ncbi:MAG: S46 family peptidase [Bacteroidales bacterium]|nr:S46 family peptidase [Bacteroidales bacterium]